MPAPFFPLTIQDQTGTLMLDPDTKIEDMRDLMNFHIKNILLSCPGERIWNPDFGACLKKYLFELETVLDLEDIARTIRQQLSEFAPYINIVDVLPRMLPEENALLINIRYYVNLNSGQSSMMAVLQLTISEFDVFTSDGTQLSPI